MRKQTFGREHAALARQKALLIALSDDLILPLLQIRTGLETLEQQNFVEEAVKQQSRLMAMSAEAGLQLAEAYRLVLQAEKLQDMPLEPVAIGAVLDEVARQLTPYAKEYATEIHVDVQGRLTPVLAHPESLIAAMQCLSASLIRAQAAQSQKNSYSIILGAHRSGDMISAGVFTDARGVTDKTLRAARSLVGQARQPIPALPNGAASGVLIADMLCSALWQPLKSAAHKSMPGLAFGIPVSKQLQLV